MSPVEAVERIQARNKREVQPIEYTREGCRVLRDVYRDPDGEIVCEAITLRVPA